MLIMNHLDEIRLNSNAVDWNFTPRNQNPVDLYTRYMPFGLEQSHQFSKCKEPKINLHHREFECNYLVNTVQNLTENIEKITYR